VKITDPVCKMTIEEAEAAATSSHLGKTYHFCSRHCKEKFDGNPEAYIGAEADAGDKEGKGGPYTCPMHPEIIRNTPGACPKCGMALEPRTVAEGEDENPELIDMTQRFRVSTALTIPLVIIAMRHMIPGISALESVLPPVLLIWL